MKPVFLDTSGLIAVINSDDQWHALADSAWRVLLASSAPLITTSLVLIELGDGLSRIHQRKLALDLRDRLHSSSRIEIIQMNANDERQAWELFRQRGDKEWGMTDCVSFVVMQDREVSAAFSIDHHFEQAGFNILVKS